MLKPPLLSGTHLFTALCLLALPGFAEQEKTPSASAMTIADHWSLPGILGSGVKTSDAYTDGNLFLTFPAYSTIGTNGSLGGDVIFIEPYSSWGEQDENAVSLGLGWRHLFSGESTRVVTHHDGHQAGFFEEGGFIGANLFVDMLDTQFDNRFWQLGFGIEASTRYLELRANYYLPLSDRQVAKEMRTSQSFTQRSTVSAYEEPFGTGYTIQQDLTRTTFATTTTIERLFRSYEDGMEGWDAEVALLLPWIDQWMDVKLIGGYYAFDNQPFGPQAGGTGNVEGWKAGVEVRPVPAVVLNATWFEDERLTGSDWTAGVHLELPFEAGDLGDGKGLWDRLGDAFRPRRRHLAERMVEPVKRQNAAVKIANSVEEDKSATEVSVVTKVVSKSRRRIVLADSVVFVDNAIGSPANPGTYEAPLDTIEGGAHQGALIFNDRAIVFVQGRPGAYTESVTISHPVRLLGSGIGIPAGGGRTFHGRTQAMPLVNGGFRAYGVRGTVEIAGFEIIGGGASLMPLYPNDPGSGIYLNNVQRSIIHDNYVHHTSYIGIEVHATAGFSAFTYIANNRVANAVATGIYVSSEGSASGDPTRLSAVVDNNTVSASGGGIALAAANVAAGPAPRAIAEYMVRGNNISGSAFSGLVLTTFGSAQSTATVSANHVFLNGDSQIVAETAEGSTLFLNSVGTLSNSVLAPPGVLLFDSDHDGAGPDPAGSILINGLLHPANIDLP